MKLIKNVFFIFILLLFSLAGHTQHLPASLVEIIQEENSFTITFHLPDYILKDTMLTEDSLSEIFKCIEIDDYFGIISDTGYPQLPQLTFDLYLPEDASEFQVTTSIDPVQNITIDRRYLPFQDNIETDELVFQINNDYYDSDGSLYNFTSQISDPYLVMGAKGISFTIFPFIYNPVENRITVISTATFTISYDSQGYEPPIVTSEIKNKYLSIFFENYPYNPGSSYIFSGRYLMITDPEYESTLTYFANYKRNIGYTVDVVNTIATGTSATAIKNYIQTRYDNMLTRPDYVLLVGDIDNIPASEGIEGYYSNPLTDLEYAKLDGDDYFADVFLGRFSVSNISELQNIINKTIFMEMNIHRFDKKAVLLSGGEDGEKKFDNPQIWIKDNVLIPTGYDCDCHFAVDGANRQDGINALNGNYHFFIYRGHGGDSIIWKPFCLTEYDINTSSNTIYPFGFGFACLTNNFGHSTVCFGESWIRSSHGGICYFGATTSTNRNTNNVIEKRIFGNMNILPHLSPWINLGMKDYYKRFWSWLSGDNRKIHMVSYNLLGDPSLSIDGTGCIYNFTFTQNEMFQDGDIVTYHADYSIRNNTLFVIQSGADVSLKAGNEIILQPGFHAISGDFEAKIEACNSNQVVMSLIPEQEEKKEEKKEENKTDIKEAIIDPSLFSIFPNPTKEEFSVSYTLDKNDFVKLDLYSINGSKLKSLLNVSNQSAGNHYFNFSISELSTGIYVLVFTSSAKKYTYKLIKK
jgi:gingipain R